MRYEKYRIKNRGDVKYLTAWTAGAQASVVMPQEELGAYHVPHLIFWIVGRVAGSWGGAQVLVGGIQEYGQ